MEISERTKRRDFVFITTVCVFIVLLATSVRAAENKMITIKGSDTMVHLVTNWAEAFMKQKPDVEVAVTGGGSGTGIAALINGTTEICASSRDMKDKEKQQAREKGVEVKEVVVARDGIAVVVNPKNPIKEIDMQQLAQIFTGATTRWNQLNGGDEEILVFSRESSSGTYVFFQEHVLKNKDYTPKAKLMPATSAIIEAVSADKGAIGYVGLGYALAAGNKVKILAVKADANSPAIIPSDQTVIDGSYPVARPLYLYVSNKASQNAAAFVDFCLSDAGQTIVRESGYVSVKK
ncbi:MAG: phosphate ABC transporter substrate-binding protein [Sedimentisphaerales bacterium]